MVKVEKGKPSHCVEIVSKDKLTGNVLVSDDEIRVDLYGYDGYIEIDTNRPIYLVVETGQAVSLFGNITGGTGTNSNKARTTYHQAIISNVAVIGYDHWSETDKIKKASFEVKHMMNLLHHREKIKAIGASKFPNQEHFTIFEEAAQGVTLRGLYGATYTIEFDSPRRLWPIFEIEFDEAIGLHEYIGHVSDYSSFLSFCLGVALTPDQIQIHRLPQEEGSAADTEESRLDSHEVHYIWHETKIDARDIWVGGSPVVAFDNEELRAFRACIVAWMNRADMWKKSCAMMMSSYRLRNVMTAERLINACRWLDEIPILQSENALSDSEIEAIANAGTQKAAELGYNSGIRARVENAIRRVKAETSDVRFKRLVDKIEEKFGKGILPEKATLHLKRAIKLRGSAAHGHFSMKTDKDYTAFSKSTQAVEALCFLLTAMELPINDEGLQRIRSNPLVQNYHHCFE